MDTYTQFDNGMLTAGGTNTGIALLPWNRHPSFAGVYLKNIVTADQTDGLFTCHMVRIDPGHAIAMHTHPVSIELHEVIKGNGVCLTGDGDIPYKPGSIAVISRNAAHEVRAGETGLCLFAKFITVPA